MIKSRHPDHGSRNAVVFGTKADIWRVDCIGEGAFRNAVRTETNDVWYIILMPQVPYKGKRPRLASILWRHFHQR